MSTGETERPKAQALTALPSLESLPSATEGYDRERVKEAFDAFRRHAAQLQAQLRVLQAARKTADVEPTGHAARMDTLHLIRAAAEFADTLERDAQTASAAQLARTEEEVRTRQTDLQAREAEVERYRAESDRQRAEIVNAAKTEARDLLAKANADATRELREAEARASRLLEQSRHQATELTNAARAEVEQTLEWARAQASAVMARAQDGVEKLLAAAGLGEPAMTEVVKSILASIEGKVEAERSPGPSRPAAAFAGPPASEPPVSAPPARAEPEPEPERAPEPPVMPPTSSGPPASFAPPAESGGGESEPADGEQDEPGPHS